MKRGRLEWDEDDDEAAGFVKSSGDRIGDDDESETTAIAICYSSIQF